MGVYLFAELWRGERADGPPQTQLTCRPPEPGTKQAPELICAKNGLVLLPESESEEAAQRLAEHQ